jgi:hypothetical protein
MVSQILPVIPPFKFPFKSFGYYNLKKHTLEDIPEIRSLKNATQGYSRWTSDT